MLPPRRLAAATLAVVAGLVSPASAVTATVAAGETAPARTTPQARTDRERPVYRAECRTRVEGSSVTASCHNPFPDSDMVQLHIECNRWWDPDVDTAPVEAGPARTVELTGRCWMGVGKTWVTHSR
ncbi:hypothetical protein ABZW18_00895 [Streptomyces sp. NPDC004647]|uniref:hypothetical protein n=1 Tax=Streptomyces sp. NPDC004647 TaxID=3154671 RepID=UPI0033B1D274